MKEVRTELAMKNEKRSKELQEAIKPIEEFMNKWCCPHDMLVVQQGVAELFEGALSIPLSIPD